MLRIYYEMVRVVVVLARQLTSCQALSGNPEISKTPEISNSQKFQILRNLKNYKTEISVIPRVFEFFRIFKKLNI